MKNGTRGMWTVSMHDIFDLDGYLYQTTTYLWDVAA